MVDVNLRVMNASFLNGLRGMRVAGYGMRKQKATALGACVERFLCAPVGNPRPRLQRSGMKAGSAVARAAGQR